MMILLAEGMAVKLQRLFLADGHKLEARCATEDSGRK
jgi:hypothetical protein